VVLLFVMEAIKAFSRRVVGSEPKDDLEIFSLLVLLLPPSGGLGS